MKMAMHLLIHLSYDVAVGTENALYHTYIVLSLPI